MKTPDEIKKDIIDCLEEAIEVSNTGDAHDLLAFSDKAYVCIVTARAYIRQLESDNASKDERIQMLEAGMAQWEDVAASPGAVEDMARENYRLTQELEAVKQEMDAAVRDLNLTTPCNVCMNNKGCPGWPRFNPCQWQWRGVCRENTEVQEDE